ncbi:RNA polymerase sigma factor [Sphingobacterium pedocola]|uniref:RNA polymerase sigma-70 region 2 domain-containing protein n=1 Tax=Sphingobacterium pedocola TaxID=2082722 RepID=A0ABR9T764_9SPHI|nr:sigma factor [Sphingobacterium pedocola]MBE8721202.1 hypothetical protein [Sphingobacterium pedocola]
MNDIDTVLEQCKTTSFEKFYSANFLKIKLSLLFLGVDEESAKDLAQESFARLWVNWDTIENDMARKKFARVVSKNLWIDKYRKLKKEEEFVTAASRDIDLFEHDVFYKDLLEATNKALWKYDSVKKEMYREIKVNGASYKEVCEKFEVNIKTLERYMTEMSKSVKEFLKKHYPHMSLLAFLLKF